MSADPLIREASEPYNATVDLLERNLAPGSAERPYLRTRARSWSYDEVCAAADAAGAGLVELGLVKGDRVILAASDRPEFIFTFWGAIKAGIVPVPVAQGLSIDDYRFMVTDSRASAIVCDALTVRAVGPAIEGIDLPCLLIDGQVREGVRSWNEVCGSSAKLLAAPTTREDIALWLYTSGTTGRPKGVMHRQRHLEATPGPYSTDIVAMGPDDVILSMSKMFFAYGLGNSVYLPAASGSSVIVNEGPSLPPLINDLMHQSQPTVVFGVPAFYAGFLRLSEASLPPSARFVMSAGEALSVDLFERFRDRFGVPLIDGLGATEALHFITSNRPDDVVPGTAGRPIEGFEVRVLDADFEEVPENESGELWIRGPSTFAGYWQKPELTDRAYRGEWMRTGDLVRLVDGRVCHEGRLDDLLKVGGVWVSPVEIEDAIRAHRDVSDAAVVATTDDLGVPTVRAFVVSERHQTDLTDELLSLCRDRLAAYKVPRVFEVVDELPRTVTGKLRRFVLRSGSRGSDAR